jgi:hypothetical protein
MTDFVIKKHHKKSAHLAVDKAKFFIAKRHSRVNVQAATNSGRTCGVRGLKFVPALDGSSTSTAGSPLQC